MDSVAHEYLLLGLGLGELQEGIVDSLLRPAGIAPVRCGRARDAG